ncbi:Uma2 family endonuclease [Aerosakkonema funiforme]|uniref:Uma2 family endonuclease n=2 Tax=Oscillatoriophycideae TaxID=1301283 RepID=A0A926VG56_9CYAN|nr:Uma2 family endonuclease [Aerosakkonema funiforme]MBD2183118.1 Uma2 family endonuclease [Aerosakkonema funiforme FACHB-1375]
MQQTDEKPVIIYPSSDGKPMADSTIQYDWITKIKANLDGIFKDDPNVFITGDLIWYPVEERKDICQAPDVMVVFGREKKERKSYLPWNEDNIAPQVVFEILSETNTKKEMNKKLLFYNEYNVEEYYLYDPKKKNLDGWLRNEGILDVIESMSAWVSPRLGVRFEFSDAGLELYRPDGQKFIDFVELERKAVRLAAKLRELGIDPETI